MYLKSSGFLPEVLAKLRKIDEYTKFNVNSLLIVHDNLVTFGTQFYFIRTCIPEILDSDLFGKKVATGTKGRKDKYVSFHGGIC